MYADFIIKFRELCGEAWKITIETSLFDCSYATIARLAQVIDKWIVDVKDMNFDVYRRYTGQRSHILQSLSCLQRLNLTNKVTVKVPLIPGYNTEEDVKKSIEEMKQKGFTNIETMRYIKRLSKYPPLNQE